MFKDRLLNLTKQLYPTGRAFKIQIDSYFEGLHKALIVSENAAYEDTLSTLNAILPDNDNFSADDATDWERRLGLISNPSVSLSDRKAAIKRKLNYPNSVKLRQSRIYLESQLRLAGFDVYVYENRFYEGGNWITKNPVEVGGGVGVRQIQYGEVQYGTNTYGGIFTNIIANHIDEKLDENFGLGSNLKSTFFVGGNPLGTVAQVPEERKDEFRQLILRIKPLQTVGFLFIEYI